MDTRRSRRAGPGRRPTPGFNVTTQSLKLITPRLLLRPFEVSDYEVWARAKRSLLPRRNRFDRGPSPAKELTRAKFTTWVKWKHELRVGDIQYKFGVFDKQTGELYGHMDLMIIARASLQVANLGYEIHNCHWGKGYAKEAAKAIVSVGFKKLRLYRIEAGAVPSNRASISVMRGIGMKREGLRRKYVFDGKKWVDILTFVARAEDFGRRGVKPSVRVKLGS